MIGAYMTLLAVWCAEERLWMASDSRLSDGGGPLIDEGVKIFELPVVCRAFSEQAGFFPDVYFATSFVHVSLSKTYKGKLRQTPVWVLRYRLGSGKQSRQVLGPAWTKKGRPAHGHLTEDEARMKAQAFAAEHATDTPDARRSFRAALDSFVRYCTQEKGLRGSTMHEYRKIGERLAARPWRGEFELGRPTAGHVRRR
jgi:hypothetical protein